VPAQPSPSPDRAPDAQAAGPVPLTLARGRGAVAKPPRHLADLPMAAAAPRSPSSGSRPSAPTSWPGTSTGVTDPAQMTDLPAAVREALTAALLPPLLTPVRHQSADGGAPARRCGGCTTARWSRAC
jgi:hypothetical protein